jgi:hypothetical protein
VFKIIDSYVSSGKVTPQVGYLYLLIANGCNGKEELATRINATQRTVERNFKILADLGLAYSNNGFYYASDVDNVADISQATAMSPDLKDFKIQDQHIYISRSNDEVVEIQNTAKKLASLLKVSPARIEEAFYRAIGSNTFCPDAAFEACFVTRSRIKTGKVHSAVGYFCTVLRNMYFSGAVQAFADKEDKPCKEWEHIKEQIKPLVSKPTYYCLLEPARALIDNGVLMIKAGNKQNSLLLVNNYLELIKKYWNGKISIAS